MNFFLTKSHGVIGQRAVFSRCRQDFLRRKHSYSVLVNILSSVVVPATSSVKITAIALPRVISSDTTVFHHRVALAGVTDAMVRRRHIANVDLLTILVLDAARVITAV
jgi:hypothetical protein